MYNPTNNALYNELRYQSTCGSFEFQFPARDNIARAVKKYNEQRAAEMAELKKEPKPSMPRFCKVRHTGRDVLSMVKRDHDVETQLSMQAVQVELEGNDNDYELSKEFKGQAKLQAKLQSLAVRQQQPTEEEDTDERHLFDIEVNTPIVGQIKTHALCRPHKKMNECKKQDKLCTRNALDAPLVMSSGPTVPQGTAGSLVCLKPPMCPATKATQVHGLGIDQSDLASDATNSSTTSSSSSLISKSPTAVLHVSYEEYPQQLPKYAEVVHKSITSQAILTTVCSALNPSPMEIYQFMERHRSRSITPEPIAPYFVQDSDLENEYADRKNYLSYCDVRPYISSDAEHEDLLHQYSSSANFVEIEQHRPYNLSLVRRIRPMRYTSQNSSATLLGNENKAIIHGAMDMPAPLEVGATEELNRVDSRQLLKDYETKQRVTKVPPVMNNKSKPMSTSRPANKVQARVNSNIKSARRATKTAKSAAVALPGSGRATKSAKTRRTANSNTKQAPTSGKTKTLKTPKLSKVSAPTNKSSRGKADGSHAAQVFSSRQTGGREKMTLLSIPTPTNSHHKAAVQSSPGSSHRKRKTRALLCTKSLEDLKYEKLSIYNRMSLTQERIIVAMDRLQNSLLQLEVPECSHCEKARRERNAFEFCVRFSRNFLYPLKGMIDDVRQMSVASFSSATSNDPCYRVLNVYALMHQSIATYQRQLRYFLLDKVPQKLSALMEMIYTMTNVSLDKGLFDRQDPIIECLLQRCTKFLAFIEDMQEERFQLARENFKRLQMYKRIRGPNSIAPTALNRQQNAHTQRNGRRNHKNYDLKMCLNELKLYEPRLMLKEPVKLRQVQRRVKQRITSILPGGLVEPPSEVGLKLQDGENVQTHIERVHCDPSSLYRLPVQEASSSVSPTSASTSPTSHSPRGPQLTSPRTHQHKPTSDSGNSDTDSSIMDESRIAHLVSQLKLNDEQTGAVSKAFMEVLRHLIKSPRKQMTSANAAK